MAFPHRPSVVLGAAECVSRVNLYIDCKNLKDKDFFSKSDPCAVLFLNTNGDNFTEIGRTEIVKNNLNPKFETPISVDYNFEQIQKVSLKIYDIDNKTKTLQDDDLLGQLDCALGQIVAGSPFTKPLTGKYNKGEITIRTEVVRPKEPMNTFVDYIVSGMQLNFTVAIDFTSSNGNPQLPTSLHYIHPTKPNEYMRAIRAIGDICKDYDTDNLYPALGFGGRIPPSEEVNNDFYLTLNPDKIHCKGIDGVLEAYANCFRHVELFGPTIVSPVIRHVATFATTAQNAEATRGANNYYVLLLLTDGVFTDMDDTLNTIVSVSRLPMSLIIVGVGEEDFSDLRKLTGIVKSPSGELAQRDIVQFVPFRDFKQKTSCELTSHVMAEIPKQVTEYFAMRGLPPNKQKLVSRPMCK